MCYVKRKNQKEKEMVKGCERRVIVYKSKDSKYFLEAHFFVKPEICRRDYDKRDIVDEANRIIEESCGSRRRRKTAKAAVFLLCSFLFGAALSSVVTLFLCHVL